LFDGWAPYWRDVYRADSFDGAVYRHRLNVVLDLIGEGHGRRLLDAGCGAGALTVAAARQGFQVEAVDASARMAEATLEAVEQASVGDRVHVGQRDVERLPYADGHFDAAVAVGLLPWVAEEDAVMGELARVLRPGAVLVATFDNASRLPYWLSLSHNPLLNRRRRPRARYPSAAERRRHHFPGEAVRVLESAGADVLRVRGVGYGPIAISAQPLFPDSANRLIGAVLQWAADRRLPSVNRLATHLVLAARIR
jgi:ubiquinone/menaquinone biosynthesis C-methylase UbiE